MSRAVFLLITVYFSSSQFTWVHAQYDGFVMTMENEKIMFNKIQYDGENVILKVLNNKKKVIKKWYELKYRVTTIGHTDYFMKDPTGEREFIAPEIIDPGEITCYKRTTFFGSNGASTVDIYLQNEKLGIKRVYYTKLIKADKEKERILKDFKQYFESEKSLHSKITIEDISSFERIIELVHEYNSERLAETKNTCLTDQKSRFTVYRRKKNEAVGELNLTLNDSIKYSLPPRSKIIETVPADCISKICLENEDCYLIKPSMFYKDSYQLKWNKTTKKKSFEWVAPYYAKKHLYNIQNISKADISR